MKASTRRKREEMKEEITLKDLCPTDKARIKQLVEDLARVGTEKDQIEIDRQKEKLTFEEKLSVLLKQKDELLKEKTNLERNLKESKKSLKSLQERTDLLTQEQMKTLPTSSGSIPSIVPMSSGSMPSMVPTSSGSIPSMVPRNFHLPVNSHLAGNTLSYKPLDTHVGHQPKTNHLLSYPPSYVSLNNHKQPLSLDNYTTTWHMFSKSTATPINKLTNTASPINVRTSSCDCHVTSENTPPPQLMKTRDTSMQTVSYETVGTQTDESTSPSIIPLIKRKVKPVPSPSAVQKEIFSTVEPTAIEREEDILSELLNEQCTDTANCEMDIITSLQNLSALGNKSLSCDNHHDVISDEDLFEELFFI